jgi:hypothetical protein
MFSVQVSGHQTGLSPASLAELCETLVGTDDPSLHRTDEGNPTGIVGMLQISQGHAGEYRCVILPATRCQDGE